MHIGERSNQHKDYEAESNAVNTTFQSKGKNNVYAQKS